MGRKKRDTGPVDEHGRTRADLPDRCECGGEMEYEFRFNRWWGACTSCTPVTEWKIMPRNPVSRLFEDNGREMKGEL